jgi:DNA-binding transcriptional LysR family regulator
LIAIDEEGTFTAAADLLRTVQSNVSEQVRQLEAELGVTLLARGRSGAKPTESGEVVLSHARRIRRELQLLRDAFQPNPEAAVQLRAVEMTQKWLLDFTRGGAPTN